MAHDSETEPRGLTRLEAAKRAGISRATYDKARKAGIYPGPTLPGDRIDAKLLERAMDRLSGIEPSADDAGWRAELEEWAPSK